MRNEDLNLIDAQDHLEDVFQRAVDGQPQRIEQEFGRGAVVVISAKEYAHLAQHKLFAFLRASPLAEAIRAGEIEAFEIDRSDDLPRDIDLD